MKQVAPIVGGGGGGKPDMAQAGGKDAGEAARGAPPRRQARPRVAGEVDPRHFPTCLAAS